jgi:LuxR family transcriptional regulator, maltose regulon positive regulatory protein
MALHGSPTQAPAQVRERDALLATKFAAPRVRPDLVARPRLVSRLDDEVTRGLVLVSTPAGFGKTTLLATWAGHARLPVAWLSLDDDDNDPARFWRYVVAALDRVHPGIGEPVLALFTGPNRPPADSVVTALVNEVASLPGELGLVLDDYHVMTSREVHQAMALLLGRLPPQLHMLIASRTDPPLPLPGLRAQGRLGEFRAADLRFSPHEAAVFLRDVWGLDLPAGAVAALEDRTEGWVAGLQLAALSLQGRADTARFMEAFTGSHRFVLDYLSQEVLERQPEQLRTFLLETSVLERLCGPLCDAVGRRGDGQQMLEALERANLFLVPLDEQRRWYRYHHLFADVLRARLRQSRPEQDVAELHRRAGLWCEEHGLIDIAARHHLAAGEAERAARVIERHVEELLLRTSERATVERWTTALPEQAVRARPRLLLVQAHVAVLECRLDKVDELLASAERAPASSEPHAPSVGRRASVLANLQAVISVFRAECARLRGDPELAARHARAALASLAPEDELLGTFARYELADAEWLRGRLGLAERGLAEVVAARLAAERHLAMRARYEIGLVQQAQGRLGAALGTYERTLEVVTETGRPALPTAGLALIGLAEILREKGDLDTALRHAIEGIERCRNLAYGSPLAAGLVTLAWIHQARAEPDEALRVMEEAQRVVPSPEVCSLYNPAPAERARLLLAHGRIDAALGWVTRRGLAEGEEPSYPRERDYLVLARVLLAQEAPDLALPLLRRLLALAEAQDRLGSVLRVRVLLAQALQSVGDHEQALRALAEALCRAWPEGYVAVFADEGPAMAALLRNLLAARQRGRIRAASTIPAGYLSRLVKAMGPAEEEAGPHAGRARGLLATRPATPLTDRELEVLRLLAAGRRNQEIADQLVVTVETVKKHVSHILDKLGAANRMQAVVQARDLGLV